VDKQDTTAVLSPISGQAEDEAKNSQPAPKPSADALAKAANETPKAAERKRAPKLNDDKRFKIFCGSANRPLSEEV